MLLLKTGTASKVQSDASPAMAWAAWRYNNNPTPMLREQQRGGESSSQRGIAHRKTSLEHHALNIHGIACTCVLYNVRSGSVRADLREATPTSMICSRYQAETRILILLLYYCVSGVLTYKYCCWVCATQVQREEGNTSPLHTQHKQHNRARKQEKVQLLSSWENGTM